MNRVIYSADVDVVVLVTQVLKLCDCAMLKVFLGVSSVVPVYKLWLVAKRVISHSSDV